MIKKIVIGAGAVAGLLIIAIVVLPFVIDVNRFKEPIVQKVEEQINGKVSLGRIGLKLFPFIGLRLEELTVTNLPDSPFGETPMLKLGEFDFRISVMPLLQKKVIASLVLESPEIQFLKTADGSNVDLLIKKKTAGETPPIVEEKKEGKPAIPWVQEVRIERIKIDEGRLVYDDISNPDPAMVIGGFRFEVTNAVLTDTTKPIGIDLGMRLFDQPKENLSFVAAIAVDQEKKNASVADAKLTIAGSPILFNVTVNDYEKGKNFDATLTAPKFNMNSIYSLLPQTKKSLPPGSRFDGALALNVTAKGNPGSANINVLLDLKEAEIQYGEAFLKSAGSTLLFTLETAGPLTTPDSLNTRGTLSAGLLRLNKMEIADFASRFSYASRIARLEELKFGLFEGAFAGSGAFDMSGKKPGWAFALTVDGININTVLTQMAEKPDVLTGRGHLALNIKGSGQAPEEVKKSVSGTLQLALKDGELKATNIASGIFSEKLLGGMTQAAEKFPSLSIGGLKLSTPAFVQGIQGTPYQELKGSATIEEGKIKFPELNLGWSNNLIQLGGTLDLDLMLDMQGKYLLSKEATEGWIENPTLRKHLSDSEGRFLVPFTITGELKSPVVSPDTGYAAELAGKALAAVALEEGKKRATEAAKRVASEAAQKVAPKVEETVKEEIQKIEPADIGQKLKKLF